jgi:hypothetical protein
LRIRKGCHGDILYRVNVRGRRELKNGEPAPLKLEEKEEKAVMPEGWVCNSNKRRKRRSGFTKKS